MQDTKSQLQYNLIDIESLIISALSILVAKAITYTSDHPFLYIFSVLFSFVPLFILSFKLTLFLERKNIFNPNSRGVKLSLFGLLLIPITFIPLTLLNYLSTSYVLYTFIAVSACTVFGQRIDISKKLPQLLHSIEAEFQQDKKNLLIFLQVLLLIVISFYLNDQSTPISPSQMSYPYLIMLAASLIIPSYLLATRSKLNYLSVLLMAVFLFGFFAIQNIVYYGGDTGFSVSVVKYMINGGDADFVSPSDRWRFGSATTLGFHSLLAYLSESSDINPEIGIAFANAIGLVFVVIGGYMFANFLGRNEFEKSLILFAYVLFQASIYYFDVSPLRSISMLFLALPLIIPLFTELRFNKFGKMAFAVAMFSIGIIHPLSFIIVIVMMAFLFKNLIAREKLAFLGLIVMFGIFVALSPSLIRSLSISPEEPPALTFRTSMFNQLIAPFPSFTTSEWPGAFTFKISFIFTFAILLIAIFMKNSAIPRKPIIACLILFFSASFFIETSNFPILRLSMFFASIGIVSATVIIVRYLQNHKISLSHRGQQILQISLLSAIAMLIIINSYPKERALRLDTLYTEEYLFLKDFVDEEKDNFDNSLIFAHIETLRYMNGLDGSILYYNDAPTAFSMDFTHRQTATEHYDAFSRALSGDLSKAENWTIQRNATSAYFVILYRFVPAGTAFNQGDLIIESDVGVVRKISFTDSSKG